MLADWIAVRMEQIYFEAQMAANKELDEIEEEVVRVMDLEAEQKDSQKDKPAERTSVLSKEVKVDEPDVEQEADNTSEMDNYPPE